MKRFVASTAVAVGVLTAAVGVPASADVPNTCGAAGANRQQNVWLSDSISPASDVDWFRFSTTSGHWTLVTLGSLSANLSLTIYNGSCHAIATSNHGGRHYKEIYRDLPPGRYYAKVAGVAGATGAYQLRFRPLRTGIDVLSSHTWRAGGINWIAGEVLNNQSVDWFMRWAVMTMYDKNGHVLRRNDQLTFPDGWTRARHRSQFLAEWTRPKGFDHYRVTVVTQALESPFPRLVPTTFLPGVPWTDPSGQRHYPGQLRNDGSRPILLGEVMYTLYGMRGQVLYVRVAPVQPGTLRPRHIGLYDVVFDTIAGVNAIVKRVVS